MTTKKPESAIDHPQQKMQTEADVKSADGNATQDDKSSHDAKSHTKAGKDTGAGGGKKQERKH